MHCSSICTSPALRSLIKTTKEIFAVTNCIVHKIYSSAPSKVIQTVICLHITKVLSVHLSGKHRHLAEYAIHWMMELSAPWADLQVAEIWREWLIHQTVLLPFRVVFQRDLNRLEKRQTGISWSSTKGNYKSCTWGRITPCWLTLVYQIIHSHFPSNDIHGQVASRD